MGQVEVRVCRFAPGVELTPLTRELELKKLSYRIDSTAEGQDLYTSDGDLAEVSQLLDSLGVSNRNSRSLALNKSAFLAYASLTPITYATILLGILGALIVSFRSPSWDWFAYFTYTQITEFGSYIKVTPMAETYLQDHQWWRLITPAFLHFGIFHITFNTVATLEFGRRIEVVTGRVSYLGLLLVLAAGSNTTQFLFSQSSNFGGLSGVAYGLFGAVSVLYWRTGMEVFHLPKGFQVMMLVMLLLGPLGVFEYLFGLHVADPAHFSGLIIGALAGLLLPYRKIT